MSESAQFIALSAEYIAELQGIEQRAYSHPWSAQIMADSFRAKTPCWGLLDDHGAVLGYAFVLTIVGEAQILNITVAPEHHRNGLGRKLMAFILDNARAQGCTQVLLEVRRSNKGARRLYEQLGFATIGLRKGYYPAPDAAREDALVLALDIL